MTFGIAEALQKLYPESQWSINGEDYSGLNWFDSNTQEKPTEETLIAEAHRLQAEYDAFEYRRLRAAEYPSFAEQFDILYHGGYEAWRLVIQEVKDKHPKQVTK